MRFRNIISAAGALVALCVVAPAAWALDWELFPPAINSSSYEVRLGAYAHDPFKKEAGSADVNVELLFPKLFQVDPSWAFLVPRPQFGVTVNTDGKTSFAYFGGVWTFDITRWFFIETVGGGAIHTGELDTRDPFREAFGCRTLFHIGGNVGFRLTDTWSIMGSWQHISNARLCVRNNGEDVYGGQIGYRF
jgi:lipid A 3-O-deacylase